MTAVLVDTHTLVWALSRPTSLGRKARRLVEDPRSTVYVSSASAFEMATKHRLGKMPGADTLLAGYHQNLSRLGAAELAITSEHALFAGSLDWPHRDPFDRLLAAQAILEGLPLLTKDAAFAQVSGLTVVW